MLETILATAAASWGVLMGLSPLLQIRRMLTERSSRDVSVGYFAVLLVGFVLWIAYGVASRTVALVVPNAVAVVITVATIAVAVRLRAPHTDPAHPDPSPERPYASTSGRSR